ncbi:MAG: pyridoxal phosphate-dependent aminotransferase [Spirochaetales bacterium]|nr:pyridoxal phosphate-dependent aminotransferase [Spirochaetales bacterium]
MYDFDSIIDRTATEALKWHFPPSCRSSEYKDVIAMWIADLDMASPPEVVAAITERAAHPVYGYSSKPESFFQAYIDWMRERYNVRVDRSWLSFSPGIVPAIATAIRAFTERGDGIAITPPVYHPFKHLIEDNGRLAVEAPLVVRDGRYEFDLDALDAACARSKILVLCSPHNPVGRVWTTEELAAVVDIADRRDVIVISDEIHADLVYAPHAHVPMTGFDERLQRRLVACWAPSKTFNIAGLQASYITIPDERLRAAYDRETAASGVGTPNCLAIAAAEAAYGKGGPWLQELLPYLRGNYEYLCSTLAARAPALKVYPCEGTFLAWIDFCGAGLSADVGPEIIDRAGLWLDAGARFGTGGEGFARLNFGCPRPVLEEAVQRLIKAFG